jgi:hypothetical protein
MPDLPDSTPPPLPPAEKSSVDDWERFEGLPHNLPDPLSHGRPAGFPASRPLPVRHRTGEAHRPARPRSLDGVGASGRSRRAGIPEGYFRSIMREKQVSSLSKSVEKLCGYAGGAAVGIAEVSHELERELNQWQRKHPHGSR